MSFFTNRKRSLWLVMFGVINFGVFLSKNPLIDFFFTFFFFLLFIYFFFFFFSITFLNHFIFQVCDPNGRWYLADSGSSPGDLLLLTGKALSHTTAGLRPAASYRAAPEYSGNNGGGRYDCSFWVQPCDECLAACFNNFRLFWRSPF